MKSMYVFIGVINKTKTTETIYAIAPSQEQATADVAAFASNVEFLKKETLGPGWN